MANPRNTSKKAAGLVITVILLAAMLVISSFALFTSRASVSDNQFETGTVKIALNGGQAPIRILSLGTPSSATLPLKTRARRISITACTLKM